MERKRGGTIERHETGESASGAIMFFKTSWRGKGINNLMNAPISMPFALKPRIYEREIG
jgi:hypothetical protein